MKLLHIILFSFLLFSFVVIPATVFYLPVIPSETQIAITGYTNSYLTYLGFFSFAIGLVALLYLTSKVGGSLKETMIAFNLGFFSFSVSFIIPFININILLSKAFMIIGAISITFGVLTFIKKLESLEK